MLPENIDEATVEELNAYYDWLEIACGEQNDLPEDWNEE